MEAENAGTPNARFAWLRQALAAANVAIIVRLCKYVVLLGLMVLTLKVVFDAYSFYVARRDIDAELRSKRVSSLEYLNVVSQRRRALAITSLEGRCLERTQLTLFRIFDAQHDQIKQVYNALMDQKNKMVETVKDLGVGLIDADKVATFINYHRFTLEDLDKHLKPPVEATEKSAQYQKLKDAIKVLRDKYVAIALENAPLRDDVEKLIRGTPLDSSKYWSMDAIKALAERNLQVRKDLDANKEKFGDLEDVLARYGVWTGALSGGAANNPVLDDVAYEIDKG